MARGDYYDVRMADIPEAQRVQATRVGSTVALEMNEPAAPKVGMPTPLENPFITIHEVDKAGQPIRTFHFARHGVIFIAQGNAPVDGKKK